MPSFDPLPQVRVFRQAGQLMAPPRLPHSASLGDHLHTALGVALGLWPLTWVVLLMCGLLVLAANAGAP
jgi:hypothetical protein